MSVMPFLKISRSKDNSVVDLLCHETLDPYDEPVPKMQKLSHKNVEYVPITAKDMEFFFNLLEDEVIVEFLEYDEFCCLADKYLIAMVMTYFKRAGLPHEKYNTYNFFVALHLAHDMEEDNEELKYGFVRWFFGNDDWEGQHNEMLRKRDELWMAMNYRGLVSKKCCEEVVAMLPEHPIWLRQRKEIYGGARRDGNFKWSPTKPVPGTPFSQISTSAYETDGYGRMKCINEEVKYSELRFLDESTKKFTAKISCYEE
ncbi:speedy protein 1-B-like isoform X2 [Ischnura elegans]|uniref:speedy protein 1-B-like isoform X2 n=1 Tax=Ischnura elegans TaxID=197161 RepID=UPI001ED88FD1|nr:speedy protein 1-B-like isoform X2 [Ischnura elegans]